MQFVCKILFVLFVFTANTAFSQVEKIAPEVLDRLQKFEKSLAKVGVEFATDSIQNKRQKAVYKFIVGLKEALKTTNSYYYPFDAINSISIQYAPDNSFRIFSFQLTLDNQTCRHYGAIQLNSSSLKLIPLTDMSDTFDLLPTQPITNKNWYGQYYYNIIQKKVGKQPYYFLFGIDYNDLWSRKKIIEPLQIVNDSTAVFGAPMFEIVDSLGKKKTVNRFALEYKKDANTTMNYNEELNGIVFDHTKPEDEKLRGLYFGYIPDGSYEGFLWKKNKWIWKEHFTINGNPISETAPLPAPIKGNKK